MRLSNRGFTLTEVIVVMGIFMTVLMVTSATFDNVVKQMGQQSKSAETQIEGIVGLDVLRADLEQTGYGLPTVFQGTPAATEPTLSSITALSLLWPDGFNPDTLNDLTSSTKSPPRAIESTDTTFNNDGSQGSKYLVLKSTLSGINQAVKKWSTVSYSGDSKSYQLWDSAERDLTGSERVIVLKNTFVNGIPQRQLGVNAGSFYSTFSNLTTLTIPHTDGDIYQVYGVDEDTNLRMPFNRADYYIKSPPSPLPTCAPNTGTLYKAVASHGSNSFLTMPLLDCVADMQIVYGLDTGNTGLINSHTTNLPGTAQDIRDQLKEIRVYILAQEGKKDINFSYPYEEIKVGESFDGGTTLMGRTFNLKDLIISGWKNYRWKVYTIVVRPKNLL